MDWFILLSTVLVYASLVAVIVTASLERRGRREIATGVDRASRWGFPLFFLLAWVLIATLA
jgi:surface polysaccharide O-acyltransferase-like enzyme